MALKVGRVAPSFNLRDKSGRVIKLKEISSDFTVVYFYPKDDTPGCTLEAKGFSAYLDRFKKLKAAVIGISGGDEKSKQKFCDKHDLSVTLLSDPEFKVAKKFGSFGLKKFMGRTYRGVLRNTYLMDKNKRVIKIFEGVKPETHPQEVLELIQRGGKEPAQLSLQLGVPMAPTGRAKTLTSAGIKKLGGKRTPRNAAKTKKEVSKSPVRNRKVRKK